MKLYLRFVAMHIRSALQYRFGVVFGSLSQAMTTVTGFAAIAILFAAFGNLRGYTLGEVALCYGVAYGGYAIAELIGRGFDRFAVLIRSGDYDRLLLRPQSLIFQTFCSQFEPSRIGRVIFSVVVILYAVTAGHIDWTAWRVATLLLMLLGSSFVFGGVTIATSAFCFVTVQGLEVLNIFTDGGREISSYPLTIFPRGIRFFFTFLLPFGTFNYLPLLYLSGRTQNPYYGLIPLLGIPFLVLCCLLWMRVSKRYLSTGS